MARNFIILFTEKEGSTPIVQLLDNLNCIDIISQTIDTWEPFDEHNCGPMSMSDYLQCLDLIYGDDIDRMNELNEVYTATSPLPLRTFDKTKSVGFKMRLQPQRHYGFFQRLACFIFRLRSIRSFRKNNVLVFVTLRQDVLRWALSKYHGDGTGQPGHLQFKLASGKIDKSQIPGIHVDLNELSDIIRECERILARKRKLIDQLRRKGISAWPLQYETFCNDKRAFIDDVLSRLEQSVSEEDVEAALSAGPLFEKVHSHNIRDFVINADEVLREFGER